MNPEKQGISLENKIAVSPGSPDTRERLKPILAILAVLASSPASQVSADFSSWKSSMRAQTYSSGPGAYSESRACTIVNGVEACECSRNGEVVPCSQGFSENSDESSQEERPEWYR
jgi:hypothetical protein